MRIKTGDNVIVITGKYKGAQGNVLDVDTKNNRVVVEGVNVAKIHQKPRGPQNPGGIIESELPIDISNVMLYCSKCGKGVRFGHEIQDGKKIRACKKCNFAFD